MGLLRKVHERAQQRVDSARQDAEAEATKEGASADDARAAGEKAARKQRLRNFTRGAHGAS